ncbi:MAG: 50S ribosomal protein L29 [Candidatus Omnitrophica bacterium]|nr:50S ribosomal protein L29 [Candidatus Omnitrophota bacterium]
MKIAELRQLGEEELRQKLGALKKNLLDMRMLAAGGKLDKPHQIKLIRREVARILTLLAPGTDSPLAKVQKP